MKNVVFVSELWSSLIRQVCVIERELFMALSGEAALH